MKLDYSERPRLLFDGSNDFPIHKAMNVTFAHNFVAAVLRS